MTLYILITVATILGIGLVYSFYKNARLSIQLDFLKQLSQEDQNNNNLLEVQKIEYIKRIEQLLSQTKYQESLIIEVAQEIAAKNENRKG